MKRAAAVCWLAAASLYVATEAIAASAFIPHYSYARNYISDLGVPICGTEFDGRAICSPLHALMNWGFVGQGLFFFGGAILMARSIRGRARYPLVGLAALNGIGLSLIGIYPETSAGGGLHVLGAFLAIAAGNATVFASAFAFRGLGLPGVHRRASIVLPLIAAAALAVLVAAGHARTAIVFPDGIWERLSVYTITAWELLTAACLVFWRRAPCA